MAQKPAIIAQPLSCTIGRSFSWEVPSMFFALAYLLLCLKGTETLITLRPA
jgi:hypothetical protein